MTRAQVAAKVRAEKEKHPERFCAQPSCLWRIWTARGDNPCRKHPAKPVGQVIDLMVALKESLAKHGKITAPPPVTTKEAEK